MHLLDYFYEQDFSKIKLNSRKVVISKGNTFLYGVSGSGKSHVVYDFLSSCEFGSYLYLDFSNVKFEDIDVWKIELFIRNNNIKILVLDSYDFRFNALPPVTQTIITSNRNWNEKCLKGFVKQQIFPLDFEEFIAFHKKTTEAGQLFDKFMLHGNLPYFANIQSNADKEKQNIIRSMFANEMKYFLFLEAVKYQATKVSKHKIFQNLKQKHKISKDFVYENLEDLEELFMLGKLSSYEKPNIFKYFLFDFSLKSSFFLQKDFNHHFENMVYLRLIRQNKNLYFDSFFDFLLPQKKEAFLVITFSPLTVIKRRVKNIVKKISQKDVKIIKIITINTSAAFMDSGIKVEVEPFYVWALS